LIFAALLTAVPACADTIYQFTGTCAVNDCTGVGTGVLTLSNYNPGDTLSVAAGTFVSFTYSSNLISFSILSPAELTYIGGSVNNPMPSSDFVNIQGAAPGTTFLSTVGGYWCAGTNCGADTGGVSNWDLAVAPLPEPATFLPGITALLGFYLFRRRRLVLARANHRA
jgi:hypothetical protein